MLTTRSLRNLFGYAPFACTLLGLAQSACTGLEAFAPAPVTPARKVEKPVAPKAEPPPPADEREEAPEPEAEELTELAAWQKAHASEEWSRAEHLVTEDVRLFAAVKLGPVRRSATLGALAIPAELALMRGDAKIWGLEDVAALVDSAPGKLSAKEREYFSYCDVWSFKASSQPLSSGKKGIRMGLLCSTGAEALEQYELAIVARYDAKSGALVPLWAGLGDVNKATIDRCLVTTRATFSFRNDKTLHIARQSKAEWQDQEDEEPLSRKGDCRAPKPSTWKVSLKAGKTR